ncbi:hypothetical protein [Ferruginivarius sediminum]|uniref:Uncharacterized protein n=1 Tax=Ferruginivarius sediminum TaxID=2661937 RepID=A0A369T8W3_9PROT|nr:hypothetical protein [Ferruginivarius sediminum]RDD61743.1 hypothetical protein DRB17_11145 [Ferruginivarius sediminum]
MLPRSIRRGLLAGVVTLAAASSAHAAGFGLGRNGHDLADASPAQVSASALYSLAALPDEEVLERGQSTLARTREGVALTINAANLEPNAAYTVWWVIWNKPEQCLDRFECGPADLGADGNAVFYANGRVTDDFGQATFIASLNYGEGSEGLAADQVMLPGALETRRAQVSAIVRTHKDVDSLSENGDLADALNSLIGGCADDPRTPTPDDGPGAAACEDQYIVVHRR